MPKNSENIAPRMFATAMPRRSLCPLDSTCLSVKIDMMAPSSLPFIAMPMRRSAACYAESTTLRRGQLLPGVRQGSSGVEEGGQRRDEPVYVSWRVIRLNRDAHEAPVLPVHHGYLDLIVVPEPPL